MKVCKGLLLFCFLGILISSCFNPPEFSSIPEISVEKVQFKGTPDLGDVDTLFLYLNFNDGDGDLGLDPNDPRYLEVPYNDSFFFIADGVGGLTKVTYTTVYTNDGKASFDLLNIPFGLVGKVVTDKTKDIPAYDTILPPFDPNNDCLNYSQSALLVAEAANVIDASYNITDTLYDSSNGNARHFVIEEPFYYERNVNHNNIEVRFLRYVGGSGDPFKEFDWFAENRCIDFNGRFPDLTNNSGSPVSGTIQYAMPNSDFLTIFGSTPLKLAVKIRDRALNTSKEVQTPQFVLR